MKRINFRAVIPLIVAFGFPVASFAGEETPAFISVQILGECNKYYSRIDSHHFQQTEFFRPYLYPCLLRVRLLTSSGRPLRNARIRLTGENHVFAKGRTGRDGIGYILYPLQLTVPGYITEFTVLGPIHDRRASPAKFYIGTLDPGI